MFTRHTIIRTHDFGCRARLVGNEHGLRERMWAHALPYAEKGCLLVAHPMMFTRSQEVRAFSWNLHFALEKLRWVVSKCMHWWRAVCIPTEGGLPYENFSGRAAGRQQSAGACLATSGEQECEALQDGVSVYLGGRILCV